jgi:ATP-binding cassette subfamily F protein uup
VKSCSGGERNRLLLARLFTRPSNVLVLDEPTNDLDIETLELLEELLMQYDGTLFIVSHDRTFLDNVVTQVIAFEGDGKLMEYVGGYEDWVRVKKFEAAQKSSAALPQKSTAKTIAEKPKTSAKLSFKEQRELDEMPQRIEVLEREQEEITAALGAGALFRDNPSHAKQLQQRATEIENELLQLMVRWEALENK